jgi:hypothetical protein
MLTEVVVVQVTVVVVTGRVVTITPAEWADDVDTLSDREIGTGNPGMDTCKEQSINFCCDKAPVQCKHSCHPYTERNQNVRTNFGHKFHMLQRECKSIVTCV